MVGKKEGRQNKDFKKGWQAGSRGGCLKKGELGLSYELWHTTAQCCFSITPENIQRPLGFLMFSGGIEKQQWAVMG